MKFIATVITFTLVGIALAAPAKKKPVAKKNTGSRVAVSSGKTAVGGKTAVKKKGGKGRTPSAPPRQATQQSPSPDRYKVIQQALAEKGYLKSEPTGVWDQQSAEALRQFQTSQNLPATGKLSAASLIGLGVGGSSPESASSTPPAGSPPAPVAAAP